MKFVCLLTILFSITVANPIQNLPIGYVPNTPQNIATLNSGHYQQNPEELSGQFEGDIVLEPEQANSITGKSRTGLINTTYRWPNNTVYYLLNESFTTEQKDYIRYGLDMIEEVTCLKFLERTDQVDYVRVTGSGSGCFSSVGRRGGAQQLNLQYNTPGVSCFRVGTIIHEFLHALGFYHMQSATERDDFVKIKFEHIEPGTENNFNTYNSNTITNFGVLYDPTSVMHYGAYGFSKDGYATIIPNDISLINILGQRLRMADTDIARVNAMYQCP